VASDGAVEALLLMLPAVAVDAPDPCDVVRFGGVSGDEGACADDGPGGGGSFGGGPDFRHGGNEAVIFASTSSVAEATTSAVLHAVSTDASGSTLREVALTGGCGNIAAEADG